MPIYSPKGYDQIVTDIITSLSESGTITNLSPGSVARAMIVGFASEEAELHEIISILHENLFLSSAGGEFLDAIGALVGEYRRTSTVAGDPSGTTFKFYIRDGATALKLLDINTTEYETTGGIQIPPNTKIYSSEDETLVYYTSEAAIFNPDDNEVYVAVRAENAGSRYNVGKNILTVHSFKSEPWANDILCTNTVAYLSGSDPLNDDEYRYRISNKILANQHGNAIAVRLAALAVPGVREVTIYEKTHGIGTYSLFIESEEPVVSNLMIAAVRDSIASETPFGCDAFLDRPRYLGINLNVTLSFKEDTRTSDRIDIASKVKKNVIRYINNIPLGGWLIMNELTQRIQQTSELILDFSITKFCAGIYDPDEDDIAVFYPIRLVNQKVDEDEKFVSNDIVIV